MLKLCAAALALSLTLGLGLPVAPAAPSAPSTALAGNDTQTPPTELRAPTL